MQKENRRVKMTKALLNESFLKFLEEKPISRITVKEICEDADVNRSTYYVYYSDPYDQLHKIEDALIREQAVYIDAILQNGGHDDPSFTNVINNLLHYYRERKDMLQVLLGNHGDIHLEYDILAFFAERILSYGSNNRKLPQKQTDQGNRRRYIRRIYLRLCWRRRRHDDAARPHNPARI